MISPRSGWIADNPREIGGRQLVRFGFGMGIAQFTPPDPVSASDHRLMRAPGLQARPRRRCQPKDHGERSVIAGNVLDRQFTADRPNQKWAKPAKVTTMRSIGGRRA